MQHAIYDDPVFFKKYSQMGRSVEGLKAAGEWETLKKMLPDFQGKRVLDLGCGFGWHCQYAMKKGAASVVGLDCSKKMLEVARGKNQFNAAVSYVLGDMENIDFPAHSFDCVLSSLAFHYVQNFRSMVKKVADCLEPGGAFVFSMEHPVFTAQGSQDWVYDEGGNIQHFPVDRYFEEGERTAIFLGERVKKYHHTLTTILQALLQQGFFIEDIAEPQPSQELVAQFQEMREEWRRPMMLLVSAKKKKG